MKKFLSIILTLTMLLGMVPMSVFAEDAQPQPQAETQTYVVIESFNRGAQEDLRSSELLQARVYGYEGNTQELTYKWTNGLGTDLYVYNSHNMYDINNTDGEHPISSNKSFTGQGFAWASVYGAYGNGKVESALTGTIKVEVCDSNGNLIGSDEHTGKVSGNEYTGFLPYDLAADLRAISIGLFEGEQSNAKKLLGESGILHITCTACTVSRATIANGKEYIRVSTVDGEPVITGIKAGSSTTDGDAQVTLNVSKDDCKFHNKDKNNQATINVFVFQKPATATTATTLTLINGLDDRCEYFINGEQGTKQSDGTIVFTGLTPNTDYQVTVRASYKDGDETKYVYAYVYDTTKPHYLATVRTYLDGELTTVSDIHGEGTTIYLLASDDTSGEYIKLEESTTGVYMAAVKSGTYYIWHSDNGNYHQINNYQLVIAFKNNEIDVHHYSVNYDTNGGAFKDGEDPGTVVYSSGSIVDATDKVPVLEGYNFLGWEYDGEIYEPGENITSNISSKITLKAKWEKKVNVTVNVIIDHETGDGRDHSDNKFDVDIALLQRPAEGEDYVNINGGALHFEKNKVTDADGNEKSYEFEYTPADAEDEYITQTKYTATAETFVGLLDSYEFGVAVTKHGYDLDREHLEKIEDKDGNWTINVPLVYNPEDFDIKLSVEMDEDVPKDLYPDAVVTKILFWDEEEETWNVITQQDEDKPGIRIDIDAETGKGEGFFPVWKYFEDDEVCYRFCVTAYIYGDSKIVVPNAVPIPVGKNFTTYTDGNYTLTIDDVEDGKQCGELKGAYYDGVTESQKGTLNGVIKVEKYNITLDAQGGKLNGEEDTVTLKDRYYIDNEINGYVPVMEGHKFLGWYEDKECTKPATIEKLLTEDITLYAKWDKTVYGEIKVDGTYEYEGETYRVRDSALATSAFVKLVEISDDATHDIANTIVDITWDEDKDMGLSEYKFTELDPDKSYRIEVLAANYVIGYQNISTDPADTYNDKDYNAVYDKNEYRYDTYVNAQLDFVPEKYFQTVVVDATSIGEDFRPEEALVEIYYKDATSSEEYFIIDEHTVEPYGIEVGMDKSTGLNDDDKEYGFDLWKRLFNGELYDYQAKLTKIDNEELSQWPVLVYYGKSVRWSPLNTAPQDDLKVYIYPDKFDVTYDLNIEGAEDVVYGMEHTWSFETPLTYVPTRDGYLFEGWYSDEACTDGNKIESIAASVSEATTVYAKWTARTDLALKVNYVDKANNTVLDTETKANQTFGEVVTAESLKKEIVGYTYDSASADEVVIGLENNEITLYYTKGSYNYTVNYLEEGTDNVLEIAKTASALYNATVKSADEVIAITDYVFVKADVEEITIGTDVSKNVINLYYTLDTEGGGKDGEEPDNIPDKYQKKVIYKVVNGTWADNTTADKFEYVELKTDGKWDVNGTATINAPTGMKANDGYTGGEWSPVIPATVSGTDTETFTYSFVIRTDLTLKVNYVDKANNTVLDTETKTNQTFGEVVTAESLKKEIVGYTYDSASADEVVIGLENNEITLYYTKDSYNYTVNYLEDRTDNVLETAKTASALYNATVKSADEVIAITGYVFVKADVEEITIGTDGTKNVINLYYTKDNYNYTVNYLEDGTDNVLETAKTAPALYNATVKSADQVIAITDYVFVKADVEEITIGTDVSKNVINLYYTLDTEGGGKDGEEPDTIPDKYQKKVIYKVVNGTWADNTTADKFEYVELKTDGKWDVNGTATINAPTGMKANAGYTGGEWSPVIPATVSGTDTETFTYSFVIRTDLTLTVKYVDKANNAVLDTETKTNQTFGEVVTAESLKKGIKDYTYDSASADEVVIGIENNEITLYYTKNIHNYTVNYLEEGTNNVLADAKNENALHGDVVTENAIAITDYVIVGNSSETVTVDKDGIVINFFYALDVEGGGEDGEEPDTIPDKYQKKVIYKVVNGTWEDATTADKFEYVELKTDGKWDVNGTATINAPTGMKANDGFTGGEWTPAIPATVSGTETETFLYGFQRAATPIIPLNNVRYMVEHYVETEVGTYPAEPTETEILNGEIGETVTATAKNYEGYIFNELYSETSDTLVPIKSFDDIVILKLYYDLDKMGGGEEYDQPDGIPDRYQKLVIYRIVNGTWADGTTDPIVQLVELKTDGKWDVNGTATVFVPTGMIGNSGYPIGFWDVPPSETVSGPGTSLHNYVFTDIEPVLVPGQPGYLVFGKTDGIGWYEVSKDFGISWDTVFGDSTYEVIEGQVLVIRAKGPGQDDYRFYVNGDAYEAVANTIVLTVRSSALIGAVDMAVTVPDIDESISILEKIINFFKSFFEQIVALFNK